MFHDRLHALIERNCLLIRNETGELGKGLAQYDPSVRAVEARDLDWARDACRRVWERAAAIGLGGVEDRARVLDAALGVLQARRRIEPWNMSEVMALQAELAAAADELKPEDSALYSGCSAPEALEVAPLPSEVRA